MIRAFVLALVAMAGCYKPSAIGSCQVTCLSIDDCPTGLACVDSLCRVDGDPCTDTLLDGGGDGPMIDTSPGEVCAGSGTSPLQQICFNPEPVAKVLDGVTIDTDSDLRCEASRTDVCVIVTNAVPISQRFEGTKPIILWSAGTLSISGLVDVASTIAGRPGASADFAGCTRDNGAEGGSNTAPMGSGGAGGNYIAGGGRGGSLVISNTFGGMAQANAFEAALRGGCQGAPGGRALAVAGGHGGGVAYLVAHDAIAIAGKINASGSGAPKAVATQGGSGGGSGGQIVLDSPVVTIASGAVVIALGGGGASGASSTLGGSAGPSPTLTSPFSASTPAPGPGGCTTSHGGTGSIGDLSAAGNGEDSMMGGTCGGGGGGGADGVIQIHGDQTPELDSTIIKPTPIVL